MKPTPPPFNGARIPWEQIKGVAKEGCPCIIADDERIAQKAAAKAERIVRETAAQKASKDEEKSVKRRLQALEKALWGKTYEGSLTTRRPKARAVAYGVESLHAASSSNKKRKLV